MCREIYTHMRRHLQENGMVTMLNVIDEQLHIESNIIIIIIIIMSISISLH